MESMPGDTVTKQEMKQRGIYIIPGDRGGLELRSIHSTRSFLVDVLLTEGFIENYHYNDALIFMDLRRAYESSMGIKWVRVDVKPDEGEERGLPTGEAANRYDAIRHQMGIKRAATVACIVASSFEQFNNLRAEAKDVYRIAFEDLTKAMEEVEKRLNETLAKI